VYTHLPLRRAASLKFSLECHVDVCIRDTSVFDDLICQLENNFIGLYGSKNISLIRVSGVCIISSTTETLSKHIKLLKLVMTASSHVICCFVMFIYIFHKPLWRTCFLTEDIVTS